jgi:hypothetical protein
LFKTRRAPRYTLWPFKFSLNMLLLCAARWIFVRESDVTREATKRFWLIVPHKQQNPKKRPPPPKKGEEEADTAILVVVALSFLLLSFDLKVGLIFLLYETSSRSEEAFVNVERNITHREGSYRVKLPFTQDSSSPELLFEDVHHGTRWRSSSSPTSASGFRFNTATTTTSSPPSKPQQGTR